MSFKDALLLGSLFSIAIIKSISEEDTAHGLVFITSLNWSSGTICRMPSGISTSLCKMYSIILYSFSQLSESQKGSSLKTKQ